MSLIPSPAVLRACDLLTHLAAHPTQPFTVTELARHLAIPRATCDSLLLGLASSGFVRRDAELRYELGSACIVLGDAARAANPALRTAGVHAEALARAQQSVVAVTIRDGDETRVASVFDYGPAFGIRTRAGDAITLVPPFGASFVAWDDEAQVQAWLARATTPPSMPCAAADTASPSARDASPALLTRCNGSPTAPAIRPKRADAHGTRPSEPSPTASTWRPRWTRRAPPA
jgi:DNA-binding IclR family transcriptional regulator